ncbi:MAG TPA: hypothetical protein VG488_07170 [Candidatus Angelobacter sp.]|jgi:hypothetical protein|nr:hypothetical protein [Candidatus Angelobacter sp.]
MPIQLAWSVDKDDDFDVRDFAVRLLEGAKENLERDGELASVAFVVTATQLQCHAVTFGDHEEKEAAYRDLVRAAQAANAIALVTCNDAYWTNRADAEYIEGYYPGKLASENAKECIMVAVSGPSIETWCVEVPYERLGKAIQFGEHCEFTGKQLGFLEGWSSEKPRIQ